MKVESIDQAIDVTIKLLDSIEVPVSLIRTVGIPISAAVNNLKKINEAIQKFGEENPDESEKSKAEIEEEPADHEVK